MEPNMFACRSWPLFLGQYKRSEVIWYAQFCSSFRILLWLSWKVVAKPGNEKDLTLANRSIPCKISLSENTDTMNCLKTSQNKMMIVWIRLMNPWNKTKWWSELGNSCGILGSIFRAPKWCPEATTARRTPAQRWQFQRLGRRYSGPASITNPEYTGTS